MDTKKNELIVTTSKPEEMLGKYTAERVLRSWTEDFVDEDTGDVVTIERNEVIMDKGVYLENERISTIRFHLQSGDIKEIKVSNQRREGTIVSDGNLQVWSAVISIGKKKVKLLLYADSFETATAIIKDYVELNYSGYCTITQLKEFGWYIVIEETLSNNDPESDKVKKLYKMEVNAQDNGFFQNFNFLIFATDVDASKKAIDYWIGNKLKEEHGEVTEFTTTMESAVVISYTAIIDKAFSMEYVETKKKQTRWH